MRKEESARRGVSRKEERSRFWIRKYPRKNGEIGGRERSIIEGTYATKNVPKRKEESARRGVGRKEEKDRFWNRKYPRMEKLEKGKVGWREEGTDAEKKDTLLKGKTYIQKGVRERRSKGKEGANAGRETMKKRNACKTKRGSEGVGNKNGTDVGKRNIEEQD